MFSSAEEGGDAVFGQVAGSLEVLVEGRKEGWEWLTPMMAIFLMYFVSDIVFLIM
jgi:hypothetical protein